MRSNILMLLLSVGIGLTSCKPSHEKLAANITIAEDALKKAYGVGKVDSVNVLNSIKAYEQMVKSYPKDSQAAVYLIKAGDCYRLLKQYDKAINEYQRVENEYPDSKACPNSVFVQGFVYENELKDLPKAKERYEAFIKKYPEHELYKAAQFSLNNLGVSPEELIKKLEQQNKAKNDSLGIATDTIH